MIDSQLHTVMNIQHSILTACPRDNRWTLCKTKHLSKSFLC